MNKKLLIFLTFIGLIGLLASCEKDETKVYMSSNPTAPTILSVPDLTLKRTNGTQKLTFTGTPVDPGFQASATYFLEACASGTNFADALIIQSGIKAEKFEITVADLNGMALAKYPADKATSIDIRLRAVLTQDAGTGYTPMVYSSGLKTVNITPYGLPRLDLVNSGIAQKIQSPLGDGKYAGYVKLNTANPFTLKDPDTNKTYGANGSVLAENGSAIAVETNGWYKLDVNTTALSYNLAEYNVGVVGAFTGWGGSADYMMDYDADKGYWTTTLDLPAGPMKFRLNSKWDVNWGPDGDKDLPGTGGIMALPNSSGNINITAAGNYTIRLVVNGSAGSVTFIKNN